MSKNYVAVIIIIITINVFHALIFSLSRFLAFSLSGLLCSVCWVMGFILCRELESVVEATGAMAMSHNGFASVSRHASGSYLDRIFVDMMWYKSFSIYLILRMGCNALF